MHIDSKRQGTNVSDRRSYRIVYLVGVIIFMQRSQGIRISMPKLHKPDGKRDTKKKYQTTDTRHPIPYAKYQIPDTTDDIIISDCLQYLRLGYHKFAAADCCWGTNWAWQIQLVYRMLVYFHVEFNTFWYLNALHCRDV